MAIDIHVLNFLRYASKKKGLGRVATIGRQALMSPQSQLANMMRIPGNTELGPFCEEFLTKHFDAKFVDSYDYSNYEGASYVVDMNKPVVSEKQYDTIIDCGCVEHIYNVPQALKNISLLCASGGQIIHVLPANNFCGHGFWQFSPELFFSVYSKANGYSETEVFLADLRNQSQWFEVKQPKNGERAEVISKSPLYVLCRTFKTSSDFSHENVQQSDYVHTWEQDSRAPRNQNEIIRAVKRIIKKNPLLHRLAAPAYGTVRGMINPIKLSNRNRHLRKRDVSELLAS
jgi:hypothetical protein